MADTFQEQRKHGGGDGTTVSDGFQGTPNIFRSSEFILSIQQNSIGTIVSGLEQFQWVVWENIIARFSFGTVGKQWVTLIRREEFLSKPSVLVQESNPWVSVIDFKPFPAPANQLLFGDRREQVEDFPALFSGSGAVLSQFGKCSFGGFRHSGNKNIESPLENVGEPRDDEAKERAANHISEGAWKKHLPGDFADGNVWVVDEPHHQHEHVCDGVGEADGDEGEHRQKKHEEFDVQRFDHDSQVDGKTHEKVARHGLQQRLGERERRLVLHKIPGPCDHSVGGHDPGVVADDVAHKDVGHKVAPPADDPADTEVKNRNCPSQEPH